MVRWELKNKKTGKLYWLSDKEMDALTRLGMRNRYIVTEITPVETIRDPLNIEIKKSTNIKYSDKRRTKSTE